VSYIWKTPGKRFPKRDELDRRDETSWELGVDGRPRDPWQLTKWCYLADPDTAELFTFTTSALTHKGAIIDLADKIVRMRGARPGALPVVELSSESYQSPRFGRQIKPLFRIVDWIVGGNSGQHLASQEPTQNRAAGCAAGTDGEAPGVRRRDPGIRRHQHPLLTPTANGADEQSSAPFHRRRST
jgi:hypothetical protein